MYCVHNVQTEPPCINHIVLLDGYIVVPTETWPKDFAKGVQNYLGNAEECLDVIHAPGRITRAPTYVHYYQILYLGSANPCLWGTVLSGRGVIMASDIPACL